MKHPVPKLEPLHISYMAGTRGEFLGALLYTSIYGEPPKYKITPMGRVKVSDPKINIFWKSAEPQHRQTDFTSKQFWTQAEKSENGNFDRVYNDNEIGLSHNVKFLHSWLPKKHFLNWVLIRDMPITIQWDEEDDHKIATLAAVKNGYDRRIRDSVILDNKTVRLAIQSECQEWCRVNFRDITENPQRVFDTISDHRPYALKMNSACKKLHEEYMSTQNIL